MNPIWQVYLHGNMSDPSTPEPSKRNRKKRQAQREKIRQEKEQRRVEAVERDRERYKVDHEGHEEHPEEPSNEHEESAAERFQKELCWCIQQLEKGLQNLKPSAKQAEEAKKLLRTLKSPRAPMAKKRQVMRMTFGDYRTKMQREEKKNAAAMKKTFLTPATTDKQNKSTFYRKSTSVAVSPRLSSGSGPPGGSELCTVPEADSSEESITSLEKQAHDMTLSEEVLNQDDGNQDTSIIDVDKSPSKQEDGKHNIPSCSQADYDNLSLRSSPSGASTSSSASYPPMLRVSKQQLESKQSSDSTDSDQKDYPGVSQSKNSFCFNFEIEPDDIDQGPPAKKKPGKAGSAKHAKEESGSSEGSPKIGELEKKGLKKGGRRRKSKKKQDKSEAVVVGNNNQNEKQEVSAENRQVEKQELSSTSGTGAFKFNFPEPTPT